MEIREIKLSDVKPAKYNPRVDLQPGDPDFEKLKKSIEEFGVVQVLVYNEQTGNLVGGHQTLKVLRELGKDSAEMSVVNLDLEKEKALNIALNKIEGDWDREKLALLISNFDDDVNVILAGFDNKELDNLINEVNLEEDIDFFNDILEEAEDEMNNAEPFDEKDKRPNRPESNLNLDNVDDKTRTKIKESLAKKLRDEVQEKTGKDYREEEKEEFVDYYFTLTKEKRGYLVDVIDKVKEEFEIKTSNEALIKLCEIYEERG